MGKGLKADPEFDSKPTPHFDSKPTPHLDSKPTQATFRFAWGGTWGLGV